MLRRTATPLNVGADLGRGIAGLSHSQRALSASGLLREFADRQTSGERLLVDKIELLFDRSLKLAPLTLLKQLSRVRRVVATWPGEQSGGRLKYAEMGHPEYQDYAVDGLTVGNSVQCVDMKCLAGKWRAGSNPSAPTNPPR